MSYLYELHAHTATASQCGRVRPEDYVAFYLERGYSGMVITDHFFYGNTAIDRALPWEGFVGAFCGAYHRLKREGDRQGFSVFFGLEQRFADGMDEYLVLGVTPQWVAKHPELRDLPRRAYFDAVHSVGGFVIQAHPYRDRAYIPEILLSADAVDAVEVYNAGNPMETCRQALEYAAHLGLPMVAGSDIHSVGAKTVSGIALTERVETVTALIHAIREKKATMLPKGIETQLRAQPLTLPRLPVRVLRGDHLCPTEDLFLAKEKAE